jgi:hypothetical protein
LKRIDLCPSSAENAAEILRIVIEFIRIEPLEQRSRDVIRFADARTLELPRVAQPG